MFFEKDCNPTIKHNTSLAFGTALQSDGSLYVSPGSLQQARGVLARYQDHCQGVASVPLYDQTSTCRCASVSAMLPDVLVLDEPSSNLDVVAIGELKKVIKHWKEQGKTIVIVEHRLYYLMDIADRILYMKQGEIIQDMKVEEFRKLSAEDLHTMGLRSLHPVQLAEIKTTKFSQNKISLKDFEFSYGKNQVLDIPILKVPKGSVIGILGDNGAGKNNFCKVFMWIGKESKGYNRNEWKSLFTQKKNKNLLYGYARCQPPVIYRISERGNCIKPAM